MRLHARQPGEGKEHSTLCPCSTTGAGSSIVLPVQKVSDEEKSSPAKKDKQRRQTACHLFESVGHEEETVYLRQSCCLVLMHLTW